jgi:hypothetical protein
MEVEIQFRAFLTSGLNGDGWPGSRLDRFILARGSLGSTVGLGTLENRKFVELQLSSFRPQQRMLVT